MLLNLQSAWKGSLGLTDSCLITGHGELVNNSGSIQMKLFAQYFVSLFEM